MLRSVAQRSLIFKRHCTVAFREALSIGAKHQGHMEIVRHVQTQQPSKMNLSWSCFKKIVAAHDFAYALMPSPKGHTLLALHVEDYDFATSVLNQAGFKLVYQEGLSR